MDSKVLWQGKPSKTLLIFPFFIALFFSLTLAYGSYHFDLMWQITTFSPIFVFCLLFIPTYCQILFIRYTLTEETLYIQKGVINRNTDPIDMFRVLDATADEPLFLRPFNVGYVTVHSADVTSPKEKLIGVKAPLTVKDMIRNQAKAERKRIGVKEISAQRPYQP